MVPTFPGVGAADLGTINSYRMHSASSSRAARKTGLIRERKNNVGSTDELHVHLPAYVQRRLGAKPARHKCKKQRTHPRNLVSGKSLVRPTSGKIGKGLCTTNCLLEFSAFACRRRVLPNRSAGQGEGVRRELVRKRPGRVKRGEQMFCFL